MTPFAIAAWSLVKRFAPFAVGPLLLAVVALWIQVRGFLWFDGLQGKLDNCQTENTALIEASKANAAALEKQRKEAQARYDTLAKESDRERKAMAAAASADLRAYISTHRLRPVQGNISAAPAATEGDTASIHSGVSEGAELVAVSEADLHICTARTLDYLALREWALGL